MKRWFKFIALMTIICVLITPISGNFLTADEPPEILSATYDSETDTIYVSGTGNTLESIADDVDNQSVIVYYGSNSTTYCYANVVIEGDLDIHNETLYLKHLKTLKVNSIGRLNITRSIVDSIEEEKYWWEGPNRYGIMNDGGSLKIHNSTIKSVGWHNIRVGEMGVEIYGAEVNLANSVFTGGTNGIVFHDAGDMLNSKIDNITVKNMGNRGVVLSGTSTTVNIENSTFTDNRGKDIDVGNNGNLTLTNTTYESWSVNGILRISYIHDFTLFNESGPLVNESAEVFSATTGFSKGYITDEEGRIRNVPLLWLVENSDDVFEMNYGITANNKTTYFSPSFYNHIRVNTSIEERLFVTNISASPLSYVPVNNDWEPHNITVNATVHNRLDSNYTGNITFYFGDIPLESFYIDVPADDDTEFSWTWIPDVEGYGKIRAELDFVQSMSEDNLKAWSTVFFAGYYNETIVEYPGHREKIIQMAEYGVANEDGDGHYTIYQNWALSVLTEIGTVYYSMHDITGNYSYYERGERQIDYVLGFRDEYGLFNRSSDHQVLGLYENTYHEWGTHRQARTGIALQQAYLYTGNETYRNVADDAIEFILNKVAMVNVTFHGGVNYTVPWESTDPETGERGTSKNFPFLFVNGYIQMGRLLTKAYFDENLNSTYKGDDRLLPHIYTCIEYVLNDQIDSGESKGTWPYFSYFDQAHYGDPWRRRHMHYAALTVMELANVNTYLNWKNISSAIQNYSDYIENHMTVRSAIDTNNGGSGMLLTYGLVRSLYNTTNRDASHINEFAFSNVFFNDNGTFNWFRLGTDIMLIDPEIYGFLYLHYNPLLTHLSDIYYASLKNMTHTISLNTGWNFVSTYIVPNNSGIPDILDDPEGGIDGSYDKLMYYDSCNEQWRSYVSGRAAHFNRLDSWDHTMGMWIYMNTEDNLTVRGTKPYRSWIKLEPGWNMIGFPSAEAGNNGLPVEVNKIGYFNASATYLLDYDYDPGNFTFEPGNGYCIYSSAPDTVIWKIDYLSNTQ